MRRRPVSTPPVDRSSIPHHCISLTSQPPQPFTLSKRYETRLTRWVQAGLAPLPFTSRLVPVLVPVLVFCVFGKWVRVVAAFGFAPVPPFFQVGPLAGKQTISHYSIVHADPECFWHHTNKACRMRHALGLNMARRVKSGPMRQHYQCLTLASQTRSVLGIQEVSGIGRTKNWAIATGAVIPARLQCTGVRIGRLTMAPPALCAADELERVP